MNDPATKQDLDEATGVLRGEMTAMADTLRGEMATMADTLRGEMTTMAVTLRGEMATMADTLRGEMNAMEGRLRSDFAHDMKAMEERLLREIGGAISQAANVMMEHMTRHFAALDDKYGDLPRRHAELRADLDTHVADRHLHTRPPAAHAKRTRRPR